MHMKPRRSKRTVWPAETLVDFAIFAVGLATVLEEDLDKGQPFAWRPYEFQSISFRACLQPCL